MLFGGASIFVIYLIQPKLDLFLDSLNNTFLIVINIVWLVLFIIDMIISLNVASKFKNTVKSIDIKKILLKNLES